MTTLTKRSQLHDEALRLLKHRRSTLTVAEVAQAADVTERWLWALLAEKIVEPSAYKLEKLRDFFALDAKRMKDGS